MFAVRSKGVPYRHGLGAFADTLFASRFDGLIMDEIQFGNGVGIIARRQSLVAGSSGGFLSGWDLVSAKLGERLMLASPAAGISLFVAETDLNLSVRGVPNCAVPCYFVACALVPGADPPGTYRPCVPVRIGLEDPTLVGTASAASVRLELINAATRVVCRAARDVPAASIGKGWAYHHRLPLYEAPNSPLPPGAHQLRATAAFADGRVHSSTLSLQLR